MKKIIFLCFLLSNIAFGQQKSDFEISGKLKIQIGTEIITPENVLIELFGEGKSTTTDNKGNFKFKNLKSKVYNLRVLGYNYEPKSKSLTLKNESIKNLDLFIIADCQVNGEIAINDMKNGKPRLLLIGGIAPTIINGQEIFENRYKIKYSDLVVSLTRMNVLSNTIKLSLKTWIVNMEISGEMTSERMLLDLNKAYAQHRLTSK